MGSSAGEESVELLRQREMLVEVCVLRPCGALVFGRCRGGGIPPL